MRRWVEDIFTLNYIDFSPHSCRTASASKAKTWRSTLTYMLKQGCWENKKKYKYYDKVITEYAPDDTYINRIC